MSNYSVLVEFMSEDVMLEADNYDEAREKVKSIIEENYGYDTAKFATYTVEEIE